MTLDSEEQRQILMQLIDSASWPGKHAEKCVELKQCIANADILQPNVVDFSITGKEN